MFRDRTDAGKQLAQALEGYGGDNVLVLAIPRGGAELGYQVAKHLDAEFSILVSRKLPFPDNPEAGFGAMAEDGSTFILKDAASYLPAPTIERIIADQEDEIERRIRVLRGGGPLPEIENRTVILVDDGIAMGSTMRASIRSCRNRNAGKIVVAVPVSSTQVAREIDEMVDDLVVLETPAFFRAVAQVYENWHDVSDEEVLEIMETWREERRKEG
jgi:putative phosphoribosyl transferase